MLNISTIMFVNFEGLLSKRNTENNSDILKTK